MRKRNKDNATEEDVNKVDTTSHSEETGSETITPEEKERQAKKKNQGDSSDDEWQLKYDELNNKYLRLYSDFENFRRRTAKEKSDLILTANERVLKDLLTILDDFERAIHNNENSDDAKSIKEGFYLIYSKFLNILISKGLHAMESKGEDFNIDFHEAVSNIPADENQKGKVVDVVEKGYLLNDTVLRYAKVIVGQ